MNPLRAGLRQPDQRTCGAASVTMARALRDPSYAARVGAQTEFGREVLARHRALTSLRPGGRWQVPWPRALGTPPWAVARALSELDGRRHRIRLVRFSRDRGRRLGTGSVPPSSAVYLGDRWLPRHVVLVVPADPADPADSADSADTPATLRVYDPARGRVVPLTGFTRWTTVWFVVGPDGFAPHQHG